MSIAKQTHQWRGSTMGPKIKERQKWKWKWEQIFTVSSSKHSNILRNDHERNGEDNKSQIKTLKTHWNTVKFPSNAPIAFAKRTYLHQDAFSDKKLKHWGVFQSCNLFLQNGGWWWRWAWNNDTLPLWVETSLWHNVAHHRVVDAEQ